MRHWWLSCSPLPFWPSCWKFEPPEFLDCRVETAIHHGTKLCLNCSAKLKSRNYFWKLHWLKIKSVWGLWMWRMWQRIEQSEIRQDKQITGRNDSLVNPSIVPWSSGGTLHTSTPLYSRKVPFHFFSRWLLLRYFPRLDSMSTGGLKKTLQTQRLHRAFSLLIDEFIFLNLLCLMYQIDYLYNILKGLNIWING